MLIGCGLVEQIKVELLRDLAASGVVATAAILGQTGGYTVHVMVGAHERVLVNKRGQIRVFASADACLNELSRLGLTTFSIDISGYEKARIRSPRTDVSDRARRAAAALEYDEWVRARVQEAHSEEAAGLSDPRNHDDVWAALEAAAWRRVAESRAADVVQPTTKAKPRKKD